MHVKLCSLIVLGTGHSAEPATISTFGQRSPAVGGQTAQDMRAKGETAGH